MLLTVIEIMRRRSTVQRRRVRRPLSSSRSTAADGFSPLHHSRCRRRLPTTTTASSPFFFFLGLFIFLAVARSNDCCDAATAARLLLDRRTLLASFGNGNNGGDDSNNNNGGAVDVLVGYRTDLGRDRVVSTFANKNATTYQGAGLKRVNAIVARLTSPEQLDALLEDPDVDYVEADPVVRLFGEVESHALRQIRRGTSSSSLPKLPVVGTAAGIGDGDGRVAPCSDPDAIRVGVIDSGVWAGHEDLPCRGSSGDDDGGGETCIGASFGIGNDLVWDDPADNHGTMAMGIIGAIRGNGIGVAGIVDGRSVCWLIARVFESTSSLAVMSNIIEGVEWAVDEGATVINLSLGGGYYTETGDKFYRDLYNRGVLVVAAAGNDGENEKYYPASFDSVLSVTAVDWNNERADFSQYNDGVNIAAPGTSILSTSLPDSIEIVFVSVGDNDRVAVSGHEMRMAGDVDKQSGRLVDCGRGQYVCTATESGGSGHVCLIQRTITANFGQQAKNCQDGGGVAALIFNNVAGPLQDASVGFGTDLDIPVIGLSEDGGYILREHIGVSVNLSLEDTYAYAWGTSFAAPHVTGAAIAIMVRVFL